MTECMKKCRVCGGEFPNFMMEKRKGSCQGTTNRCKKCASESHKRWRMKKAKELEADSEDKRHGTYYGYAIGCRCDRCKEANREHTERYRRNNEGQD